MKLKVKLPKNATSYALLIFNTLLLIAIFAVATFAWIPTTVRRTENITYENQIVISSLDLEITLAIYEETTDTYIPIGTYFEGTSEVPNKNLSFRLNPNDKMSYMFRIKNISETSNLSCDITFEGFYAEYDNDVHTNNDPSIFDYLSLHIVTPFQNDFDQLSLGFTDTINSTSSDDQNEGQDGGGSQQEGKDNNHNLVFIEDLALEPGEEITIIWYFELSSEASNEFWGTKVGFKSIFFGI